MLWRYFCRFFVGLDIWDDRKRAAIEDKEQIIKFCNRKLSIQAKIKEKVVLVQQRKKNCKFDVFNICQEKQIINLKNKK